MHARARTDEDVLEEIAERILGRVDAILAAPPDSTVIVAREPALYEPLPQPAAAMDRRGWRTQIIALDDIRED
jgi:hypothetical protein